MFLYTVVSSALGGNLVVSSALDSNVVFHPVPDDWEASAARGHPRRRD
jgi:hypothetical protein